MKFENLILNSLYVACFALCVLTVGAMITTTPASVAAAVATQSSVAASADFNG
ncbi:hypothetical protein [Dyella jiangningensis]|uniref:hypothetical protein n=1 Tax=Dyella jiangningensis TaxID=1379159 RepID=UPI001558BE0A|nr:hypothetical protein [Dyella jiangningensis]